MIPPIWPPEVVLVRITPAFKLRFGDIHNIIDLGTASLKEFCSDSRRYQEILQFNFTIEIDREGRTHLERSH